MYKNHVSMKCFGIHQDEGAYIATVTWWMWPNFKGLPKGFLQNCISITLKGPDFRAAATSTVNSESK